MTEIKITKYVYLENRLEIGEQEITKYVHLRNSLKTGSHDRNNQIQQEKETNILYLWCQR